MKTYVVGGAVRDELLGLPVVDRDHVVVGATPEEMLAAGFRPVGRDFPVFLHPRTHEEYALARTERKTAPGYHGFVFHASPEVTLEQDLARRDLTINAIARDEGGRLIDPYDGQGDLRRLLLRHVSPAFVEDPLRVLRVARFAARFDGFAVAPETMQLMRAMADQGEVDHLVAERVWQELAKGLLEKRPSRMLEVLRESGALARILPEIDALFGVPQRADYHPEVDCGVHIMMVIDMAARLKLPLPARFAALTHDLGKAATPLAMLPRHVGHEASSVALLEPLCRRLRVPTDCRDLARLVAMFHSDIHRVHALKASTMVRVFDRCDVWRRPERFEQLLASCEADYRGRLGHADRPYPQRETWRAALVAAQSVSAGSIAASCSEPGQIAKRVHEARVEAVKALAGGEPTAC